MQFSVVAAMSGQNGRSSGRSSISARSPVSVSCAQSSMHAQVRRSSSNERIAGLSLKRLEAVQAEIVAASLHAGRGERDAERVPQHRQVLEEDLFLQVLGAGRDEHALAAEDRRHQIGERLAGAGAGLGEQRRRRSASTVRDGLGHLELAGARLEARRARPASGPSGRERRRRRVASAPLLRDTAGTSGTGPRPSPVTVASDAHRRPATRARGR